MESALRFPFKESQPVFRHHDVEWRLLNQRLTRARLEMQMYSRVLSQQESCAGVSRCRLEYSLSRTRDTADFYIEVAGRKVHYPLFFYIAIEQILRDSSWLL